MKRRLFTTLSALSLLLFAAVCVLWVRSYWVCDGIGHRTPLLTEGIAERTTHRVAHSCRGILRLFSLEAYAAAGGIRQTRVGWERGSFGPKRADDLSPETTTGFHFHAERHPLGGKSYHKTTLLIFPHWLPAISLATIPISWIIHHLRSRRIRAVGFCPKCGYDLRATPERCPECGTTSAASA